MERHLVSAAGHPGSQGQLNDQQVLPVLTQGGRESRETGEGQRSLRNSLQSGEKVALNRLALVSNRAFRTNHPMKTYQQSFATSQQGVSLSAFALLEFSKVLKSRSLFRSTNMRSLITLDGVPGLPGVGLFN